MINRLLNLIGRLLSLVGQLLGAILTVLLVRPVQLLLRLFRPGQPGQDQTFFLDPEEAKSLGRRSESPALTTPQPTGVASSAAASTPTVTLVGTGERRRPGPNMRMYLEMAKQLRRA